MATHKRKKRLRKNRHKKKRQLTQALLALPPRRTADVRLIMSSKAHRRASSSWKQTFSVVGVPKL